jgi:hypothetical protein
VPSSIRHMSTRWPMKDWLPRRLNGSNIEG